MAGEGERTRVRRGEGGEGTVENGDMPVHGLMY